MNLADAIKYPPKWAIANYADDDAYSRGQAFEGVEFDGNLLRNEGIGELLDLFIGAGGTTAFSNANARLGVGDDTTAAAAGQPDLQAAPNKAYKAMASTYPSRSGQTLTFRAVFGGSDANYAWNEFVVDNGSTAGKTFDRM